LPSPCRAPSDNDNYCRSVIIIIIIIIIIILMVLIEFDNGIRGQSLARKAAPLSFQLSDFSAPAESTTLEIDAWKSIRALSPHCRKKSAVKRVIRRMTIDPAEFPRNLIVLAFAVLVNIRISGGTLRER